METSNLNLWSPDPGDDYALTQDLAAMADDIDEAITETREASMRVSVADQAARDALTKKEGLRVYREDTNRDEQWTGTRWMIQPGIENRRFEMARFAVPAGGVDYFLQLGTEVTSYRSESYFSTYYYTTGPDTGFTNLDAGLYLINVTVWVEGAYAGPQGRVRISDAANPGVPIAQGNFGEGQFVTVSTPWLTDGTRAFGIWANHNSGAARNMYGTLDIIRLRGF